MSVKLCFFKIKKVNKEIVDEKKNVLLKWGIVVWSRRLIKHHTSNR